MTALAWVVLVLRVVGSRSSKQIPKGAATIKRGERRSQASGRSSASMTSLAWVVLVLRVVGSRYQPPSEARATSLVTMPSRTKRFTSISKVCMP